MQAPDTLGRETEHRLIVQMLVPAVGLSRIGHITNEVLDVISTRRRADLIFTIYKF